MENVQFTVGDLVRVTTRNPGETKIHGTPFEGIVISLRGQGTGRTFIVRKIATNKVAVERIFPINSPSIESIKVVKGGHVRRAKLYYLRKK